MKSSLKIGAILVAAASIFTFAGCSAQSDTVSYNLSKDADSFKVHRLVVFHNDITDTNIWSIEGRCALGNDDSKDKRSVICKISDKDYVKEIIQMGDNVSVISIQTEPTSSDPYHYTVLFRPETIIPNIELQTSGGEG